MNKIEVTQSAVFAVVTVKIVSGRQSTDHIHILPSLNWKNMTLKLTNPFPTTTSIGEIFNELGQTPDPQLLLKH